MYLSKSTFDLKMQCTMHFTKTNSQNSVINSKTQDCLLTFSFIESWMTKLSVCNTTQNYKRLNTFLSLKVKY